VATVIAAEELDRSADPTAADRAVERICAAHPDAADRLLADPSLRAAVVAVTAASPWLTRVCVTDSLALDVLARLDHADLAAGVEVGTLARAKRLEILRLAARDLLGLDDLETVGANLTELASELLIAACAMTERTTDGLAVIGMGKLGGRELNYSSDIDVMLVVPNDSAVDVRPLLEVARTAWRVDLGLRPEGNSGPLARSLDSYLAYWHRWAQTWEFQALLKARAVAGDQQLGATFDAEASDQVWLRTFGADELRQVRDMKARSERMVTRRGLSQRELKRGKGGIRDVEFAVQLLQLVHGRLDPDLRSRSTLPALRALAEGGYVGLDDAAALEAAYRFLRTVEHRLQLYEDEQTHTLPANREARTRLARVLGYRDTANDTAVAQFDTEMTRHQAAVRAIHERLFFRPLMEAFAAAPSASLSLPAVQERLAAFGFADADRTRQAVLELTRGFSRSSQLMQQILPVLLDWMSTSPDPDLGLLGLRTLATARHSREQLTAVCRESPEGARQLCQLLGTGPRFARDFQHHPDLLNALAARDFPVARSGDELKRGADLSLGWRSGLDGYQHGLFLFVRSETLRVAARDVLDMESVGATGEALTDIAETVIDAAVSRVSPSSPFAVVGMGRLGGHELAYGSDLDLMFVYDLPDGATESDAVELASAAEGWATTLVRLIGGSTPATGAYRVDTTLRPEGRHGPQARSLDAYATYYDRWAQAWERQALVRSRFIAGDRDLGARFAALVHRFVWERPLQADEVKEIRRTKARVERERVPASEDPKFHLKLGPGSLSDVEWTAQLLQLQHHVEGTGTVGALTALRAAGVLEADDASELVEAYRFCERTRNRLQLVRDMPGDSLPTTGPVLTALARSLGTTATGLRDEYQRRTRRCRRVVERLFYGGVVG
jgi:glutamate-ammonia-ligase adenylyltransferase